MPKPAGPLPWQAPRPQPHWLQAGQFAACTQTVAWPPPHCPWHSATVAVAATHDPLWHRVPPFSVPQQLRSLLGSATQSPSLHIWQVGQVATQLPAEQQPLGQGVSAEQAVQTFWKQIGVLPPQLSPPQETVFPQPSSTVPQLAPPGHEPVGVQPQKPGVPPGPPPQVRLTPVVV